MKAPVILQTARLILRPVALEDLEELYRIVYSDPEVITFYGGGVKSRDQTRRLVERAVWHNRHEADQGWCAWVPVRRQDGRILGRIGLGSPDRTYYHKPADDVDPFAPLDTEIGYAFGKAYWGQGYASEACRAVIDYAFETLRIRRLVIGADNDNERSMRMLGRLGFRNAGNGYDPAQKYLGVLDNDRL